MKALQALFQISLAVFMVGNLLDMGLRLRISEALRGLRDMRFVVASLLWGFVVLPAFAYAISAFLPMAQPFATGLILLGMTPCAPFLPPMVDRAKGDIGLAAAFMLLASVVTVAYMPVAVPLMVKGLSTGAWTIAKPLVVFLLVPLGIGLAIHHRSAVLAERLHPLVKKATGIDTILFMLLCLVIYGKEFLDLIGSHAIGAQFLFFAVATLGPYFLSFGVPRAQRTVMSLGMATRNLGAAAAPLFAIPGIDQRVVVMVSFGMVMQVSFSIGAATWFARHASTPSPTPAVGADDLKSQTVKQEITI